MFGVREKVTHDPSHDAELRQRIEAVQERLDRHDRVVKELRLEWEEMYDKFRLLMARLTKRMKDAEEFDRATSVQEPRRDTISRPRMVGDLPEHPQPPGPRRNY